MTVKPNDVQHTKTSTLPEPNTGVNVTPEEQKQNNTIRVNVCLHTKCVTRTETLSKVLVDLPFFPSVTDTFPNYFLNFWITDFTVAGRFHALQKKQH